MRTGIVLLLVCTLLVPTPLLACMWDYDTLQMERQRFPYAQELIAGQFLRHSDAYYQWRIKDRSRISPDDRTPADYDDLAVAYEKLGEHDRAIELIQEKISRWPEKNRYESEANLGTFLIHAGRYEEGLEHIKRAIEINPEAHFGREVYQQLLVEYMLQQRASGETLPLRQSAEAEGVGLVGFARFVHDQQNTPSRNGISETQKATKGVLGMMQFGNYRSPILLEALGDLLIASGYPDDSKMLAARAYLKASYEVSDETAKKKYREKAEQVLELQVPRNLEQVEAELKQEIEQGNAFFAQIKSDESAWVAAGENLDRKFGMKYYQQPELAVDNNYPMSLETRIVTFLLVLAGGFVLFITVVSVLIWKWFRKSSTVQIEVKG
tara:strand:+ start:12931 stop:14073 length:1143 start_codon:yes stop_codon:yes gene_type:complete